MAPTRASLRWLAAVAAVALLAGCAGRPVNPPLASYDPSYGYRVETANVRAGSDGMGGDPSR